LDVTRVVLAHDHLIAGTGMHILEEVRHLFEDLVPDILLIEMTLADEPEPTLPHRAEVEPAAPRVFVLRGYHNRAYVFGLLTDEAAAGLTEYDALQTIVEAIQTGSAGAIGGRRYRIVAEMLTRQLEGAPTTIPDLTAREVEILRQLSMGKTDRAISQNLGISEWTVRYHLKNIFRKLGVKRRSEAIAWVVRTGWGE